MTGHTQLAWCIASMVDQGAGLLAQAKCPVRTQNATPHAHPLQYACSGLENGAHRGRGTPGHAAGHQRRAPKHEAL